MNHFRVGLGNQIVNSRYSATAFARADMLTATASGADSYWVGDHLNSLFPRSIATPRYLGIAKLVPKIDAQLEPWTMLGYLASRKRFARLRLGVGVTDASRRNPAVTAQAAATLQLITRGRAILGIGVGSGKVMSPTAWTGPNRWRASKRRSPRSVRCGTPVVNSFPANRRTFLCVTQYSICRRIVANGPKYGSQLTDQGCCGPLGATPTLGCQGC